MSSIFAASSTPSGPRAYEPAFTAEEARARLMEVITREDVELMNEWAFPVRDLENVDGIVKHMGEKGRVDAILAIIQLRGKEDANRLFNLALVSAAKGNDALAVEDLIQIAWAGNLGYDVIPYPPYTLLAMYNCFSGVRMLMVDRLLTFCALTKNDGERKGYELIQNLIKGIPQNVQERLSERRGADYVIPNPFPSFAYMIAECRQDAAMLKEIFACRIEVLA